MRLTWGLVLIVLCQLSAGALALNVTKTCLAIQYAVSNASLVSYPGAFGIHYATRTRIHQYALVPC